MSARADAIERRAYDSGLLASGREVDRKRENYAGARS